MFVEFKTRKCVKVNDIAKHVRSQIVGRVKFVVIVDDVSYAIWKPLDVVHSRAVTNDEVFLVKTNVLLPGRYRAEK